MSEYDLDVLVIGGGGSAGFTAATVALARGARTGMVEAGRLGGLCILAGCMPSKALLHAADQVHRAGGSGDRIYPEALERKRRLVDLLAGARVRAVEAKQAQGLELIRGRARLTGPHSVEVEGREISAASIVIAAGSTEIIPPLPGLAEAGYLVTADLMDLEALPKSLLVLGGGVMALEMAQYTARMGVKTTIIQRSPHLLSKQPPEVGELLAEALGAEGVEVFTDTEMVRIEAGDQGKTAVFMHGGREMRVSGEEMLAAFGRKAMTAGLGLEEVGVELERGAVKVDRFMRTSLDSVYAAGDVTGVNMVVNLAILQGEVAGANASGGQREIDDSVLPQAVFTDPEYARVGLSREQCQARGIDYAEAVYDLSAVGAARTYAQPLAGFMTMRADRADGRILGAEIVAPHASLLIHDTAVAMKLGGVPRDLAELPYVHPCLSELTSLCAHRLAKALARQD